MIVGALLTFFALAWLQAAPTVTSQAADRTTRLTRASSWTMVDSFPLGFKTHHPQGLVRIGEAFYLSSVEITTRTKPYAQPVSGYDRDTGEGTGHLFKFDTSGRLLADLRLGEGSIYHPGGIDYDGRYIWVPVAEYRPNSRAIVYRVDPATMKGTEVLRFADHIGALIHNTDERTLHGASWGSRRFYRWTLDDGGRVTNGGVAPENLRTLNPSHYLDYQDCKYAGRRRMLCTGVTEMRTAPGAPPFRLGGIDVVDLADGRPIHQVPVLLWTPGGLNMTQNPVWLEPSGDGLRAYFIPEDDSSTLYVYQAK
jgi:hypothetical protein